VENSLGRKKTLRKNLKLFQAALLLLFQDENVISTRKKNMTAKLFVQLYLNVQFIYEVFPSYTL